MGRRSRHTAKTGDKSIYKSRSSSTTAAESNDNDSDDNDPMYNEVERFHNRKEEENFMKLDGGDSEDDESDEEDDGITKHQEGVFDLGIGGSSDEEEDDDSDEHDGDSDDDNDVRHERNAAAMASSSDDDDDEDDDDDYKSQKLLNWGDKKHSYYHGDTADLELGQDIEDAYLEEEAGREVEKARLEEMDDADFMLDGVGGDNDVEEKEDKDKSRKGKSKSNIETIQSIRSSRQNLSKLSKSEKIKFLKANHPELLPLVQHFTQPIQELSETTMVAAGALLKRGVVNGAKEAKAVGATTAGLQYLITKSMLQASNALNLSLYLLLKADLASKKNADTEMGLVEEDDGDDIRTHPVMDRLDQLSRLTDKLKEGVEDKIPGLQDQMNNLVKAAALMEGGELSSSEGSDSSDEEGTPSSEHREDDESVDSSANQLVSTRDSRIDDDDGENESSDSDEERESQEAIQRRIMTEAKFALRHQDIDHDVKKSVKRKRRIDHTSSDYGDETEEIDERTLAASRKLASTMNSIVQKSTASSEKRRKFVGAEDEGADDEYDRLQRGLAMMEEDIGKGSDNDNDDGDCISGNEDNDEGFQSDEDEFYSLIKSKSKAKKDAKKQMYTVAPKYPRLEGEVDGERAIGKTILKNRGLVAHKPKINRNPRVKKREQYRKALIRRKGAVREVRTDEGHVYGGEATGIKSGISRSRKLAR